MSKDFETEYRQLADSEIPDLWDRIEAKLPEGAPMQESAPMQKNIAEEEKVTNPISFTRFFNRKRTAALLTAAAAVFCILAIRPILFSVKEENRTEKSDNAMMIAPNSGNSDSTNDNLTQSVKDSFQEAAAESPSENMTETAWAAEDAYLTDNSQIAESVGVSSGLKNDLSSGASYMPTEEDIADAQAVAEEYYQGTVFEVLSMEVETAEADQIVFLVQCNKGGKRVEPDRTVEVTFNGEDWEVTNEGY